MATGMRRPVTATCTTDAIHESGLKYCIIQRKKIGQFPTEKEF